VRLFASASGTRSFAVLALAGGLALATLALVWFGYRATREWQRTAAQLVERREAEVLALLTAALNRDMKGAQLSVLMPLNEDITTLEPPLDFRETCARAFARFPYPESFFSWKATRGDGIAYVFNRADRVPGWDTSPKQLDPYPVLLRKDPQSVRDLIRDVRQQSSFGRRFALIETNLGGMPYQIVANLRYGYGPDGRQLSSVVGFTVNMDWVRTHYFDDLVRQLATIGGEADAMRFIIQDDKGRLVAASGTSSGTGPVRQRQFPLLFLDPDLVPALPPPRPVTRYWTARVEPAPAVAIGAVTSGVRRNFMLIAAAALATACGLFVTAHAIRARIELAAMQSEFVSTVTHELKTPLALIRLVSETLVRGRFNSADTIRDYAGLLSQETARLTRLIDNLLTYARIAEGGKCYTREAVHIIDLVEDAMEHFQPRLAALGFETKVDVATSMPCIAVDRTAMLRVLENLVDNAIKYAGGGRSLTISARASNGVVAIEVADRGMGIPPNEIGRVFEKFFRGRAVPDGGSGLGLTIAERIVRDHGGCIAVRPRPEGGTSVEIELPAAAHG